jgi:hypothetical protein
VGAELGVELGGQRTFAAGSEIGFDVMALAHAGNDGADVGIVEDEAQCHLGQGHSGGHELLERVGASDAGFEILRNEIGVAPIALGPAALKSERAGEGTFVEGHASDDGDIFFAARGK